MERTNLLKTRRITYLALLSALVIILQLLGSFIRFGPFSVTLVLVPIVIGAAICGPFAGMWLGLVFGFTVLISGDASLFLTFSPFGTIVTVLVKGMVAGFLSGLVFRLLENLNKIVAVIVAAIVCPIVNTGVFIGGCYLFFIPLIEEWAQGTDATVYIFTVIIGFNFLFELLFNVILSPIIIRLLDIRETAHRF